MLEKRSEMNAEGDSSLSKEEQLEALLAAYVFADYFGDLWDYIQQWPLKWKHRCLEQFGALETKTSKAAIGLFDEIVAKARDQGVSLAAPP